MTDAHLSNLALLCRVDRRVCAVPIGHVVEVMRPLPIELLRGAPPFVLGLAIVRGAPTPVIDGPALLGAPGGEAIGRFVLLRVADRTVALAVHDVLDVRVLDTARLSSLPPLLEDVGADTVSAVATLDAALLLVLHSARLVPDTSDRCDDARSTA